MTLDEFLADVDKVREFAKKTDGDIGFRDAFYYAEKFHNLRLQEEAWCERCGEPEDEGY